MGAKACNCDRPEPGIATDEELLDAAQALREAIPDHYLADRFDGRDIHVHRFEPPTYATDEWTEKIVVHLADQRSATPTNVINEVMQSDAPVILRDLAADGEAELTFYPTNQEC